MYRIYEYMYQSLVAEISLIIVSLSAGILACGGYYNGWKFFVDNLT